MQVSRLESAGGVRAAERAVDRDELLRRARALRRRARRRAARRPHRPAPVGRRRRDPHRRQVPARALRVPSRGRRRSGRSLGCRPARGACRWTAERRCADARRVDRHRDQLDPPARRRHRWRRRAARSLPSSGTRASPASVKVSTRRAQLHPDAIERTVAVLREYRDAIDALGVERVRATATSASRDATNRDDFFDAAEAAVGVRPELISGEEEARARRSRARRPGSTSPGRTSCSTWAAARPSSSSAPTRPDGLISVDIGCVRLTEQFLHGDPPAAEELSQAVSVVRDHLARREPRGARRRDREDVDRHRGNGVDDGRGRARRRRVRERTHPSLPADTRRGRRGVPHARDRADRATAPQPRARTGPRRRDRRRRDRRRVGAAALPLRRDARVGGRHPRRPRS